MAGPGVVSTRTKLLTLENLVPFFVKECGIVKFLRGRSLWSSPTTCKHKSNYLFKLFCLFSVSLVKHYIWPSDFMWLSILSELNQLPQYFNNGPLLATDFLLCTLISCLWPPWPISPCDPLPDSWDKTQAGPALMPADPEQELDGNVMPLSAWLAGTTKHENWRHTWDLPPGQMIVMP